MKRVDIQEQGVRRYIMELEVAMVMMDQYVCL